MCGGCWQLYLLECALFLSLSFFPRLIWKKWWAHDQHDCFSPDPALSAQSTLTDSWPGIANWHIGSEWKSDGERASQSRTRSGHRPERQSGRNPSAQSVSLWTLSCRLPGEVIFHPKIKRHYILHKHMSFKTIWRDFLDNWAFHITEMHLYICIYIQYICIAVLVCAWTDKNTQNYVEMPIICEDPRKQSLKWVRNC